MKCDMLILSLILTLICYHFYLLVWVGAFRIYQGGSHWPSFREIQQWGLPRKSVEKLQSLLK